MRSRLTLAFVAFAVLGLLGLPASNASDADTLELSWQGESIRIERDAYGVPHVYAGTDEAVSYGAGYALAADKLFIGHAYRLAGHGQLHRLLPTPEIVAEDKNLRRLTYTAAERQRQFESMSDEHKRTLVAYIDGMNKYIEEANADPQKMPLEMVHFGFLPIEPWTIDDAIAMIDLLSQTGGAFGGSEINQAALLQRLTTAHGQELGRRMFDDMVRTFDPYSPVSIDEQIPWRNLPTHADEDAVNAYRSLNADARLSLQPAAVSTAVAVPAPSVTVPLANIDWQQVARDSAWLQSALNGVAALPLFGSNAQLVSPKLSAAGNSLMTSGPQAGWTVPAPYTEIGLHGGGWDATGMTIPGFGPILPIGRNDGSAWTITNGYSDLRDIVVVPLHPTDPKQYKFGSGYEPMDCRTEEFSYRGVVLDTDEVCRTRHGLVVSRSQGNAYVYAAAAYYRDLGTYHAMYGASRARSLEQFATTVNTVSDSLNLHYADDQGNIGWWHTGYHPIRRPGTDLRLPQDGTSPHWLGVLPLQQTPHIVNPSTGWLVNWNNEPVRGWARERAYNSYQFRILDLMDAFDSGVTTSRVNGGRIDPEHDWTGGDLARNLRHGAAGHHGFRALREYLPPASVVSAPVTQKALALLRGWHGQNVDEDGEDGKSDGKTDAATTIAGRWRSKLLAEVFRDLGSDISWANNGELRWVLDTTQKPRPAYDWLHGRTPDEVSALALHAAVEDLRRQYGNDDPSTWQSTPSRTAYARLNPDLLPDTALRTVCSLLANPYGTLDVDDPGTGNPGLGALCAGPLDPAAAGPVPGDVADAPYMDRGSYNHVVAYLDAYDPTGDRPIGGSRVSACNILPPGQSGHINALGQESPHYRDQLDLYNTWRWKPFPVTADEVAAATGDPTTCTP